MLRSLSALIVGGAATAMFAGSAQAALTYVDATDDGGNTALSAGGALVADDSTGGATWRQRDNAAFGSGGTIFEGVDPSPEIVTTISGLNPGDQYTVYVHFWDPQSTVEDWNVSAGFTSGSLTLFSREGDSELAGSTASVLANTLTYDVAPDLFGPESGRENLAGLVGVGTADGNGNLAVYIDDFGSGDVNLRTWYDGVSYELVPEPASLALIGLGGLAILGRRRA